MKVFWIFFVTSLILFMGCDKEDQFFADEIIGQDKAPENILVKTNSNNGIKKLCKTTYYNFKDDVSDSKEVSVSKKNLIVQSSKNYPVEDYYCLYFDGLGKNQEFLNRKEVHFYIFKDDKDAKDYMENSWKHRSPADFKDKKGVLVKKPDRNSWSKVVRTITYENNGDNHYYHEEQKSQEGKWVKAFSTSRRRVESIVVEVVEILKEDHGIVKMELDDGINLLREEVLGLDAYVKKECSKDADCKSICQGDLLVERGCGYKDQCINTFETNCAFEEVKLGDSLISKTCELVEEEAQCLISKDDLIIKTSFVESYYYEVREDYDELRKDYQYLNNLYQKSANICLNALSDATNKLIIEGAQFIGGISSSAMRMLGEVAEQVTGELADASVNPKDTSEIVKKWCTLEKNLKENHLPKAEKKIEDKRKEVLYIKEQLDLLNFDFS